MSNCSDCHEEILPCPDPCEEPCKPVHVPSLQCWVVPPCNEGCADTLSTDCIILSGSYGPFFKGQTLTQVINHLSLNLAALGRVYNATNTPQMVIYSFDVPCTTFTIVARRNNIQVINASYSSLDTLLNDLQVLDASWSKLNTVLYVGGTNLWEVTVTC